MCRKLSEPSLVMNIIVKNWVVCALFWVFCSGNQTTFAQSPSTDSKVVNLEVVDFSPLAQFAVGLVRKELENQQIRLSKTEGTKIALSFYSSVFKRKAGMTSQMKMLLNWTDPSGLERTAEIYVSGTGSSEALATAQMKQSLPEAVRTELIPNLTASLWPGNP